MKTLTRLWIGLAILVILLPLGVIIPAYFKSGGAWGEWGGEELKRMTGYLPRGLARLNSLWKSPLPDYALVNTQGANPGPGRLGFEYFVSGLIGVAVVLLLMFLFGKTFLKKGGRK